MIVSTKYDSDLKAKVFEVRGDERYIHSTITNLSVTTTANTRSYLGVNFTATVKNHVGQSSVAFYDGDTLLGVTVCNSNQASVTFTARVEYGYHKFYAKYMGNASCLSSKSSIEEITVTEPNLLHTEISTIGIEESYLASEGATFYGQLFSISGSTVTGLGGASVSLYLNGELHGSVTTESNGGFTFVTSANQYDEGNYNAVITFEGDDTHLGYDEEFSFVFAHDNCNINVEPKYAKVGLGDTAIFTVTAKSFTDEPIEDELIRLNRSN